MGTIQESPVFRDNGQLQSRPTKELISQLTHEASVLMKEQVHLAKLEIRDEMRQVVGAAKPMAIGGYLVNGAFFVLLFALVFLLSLALPLWASALIVAAVVGGIGAALLRSGARAWKQTSLTPAETVATLKEDRRWLSETMHDVKSRLQGNE